MPLNYRIEEGREKEGEKGGLTNIRGNTTNDNLFLARCFDSGPEIGVIPSVDFALTLNVGCIGVHLS